MKDVDLINEAYKSKIQQLDENPAALVKGFMSLGGKAAAVQGGANLANKITGDNAPPPNIQTDSNFDITDDDENNTELEPGERISGDKKAVLLDLIKRSVEEIVSGNTGPDSPCSERDALDLIVSSCQGKLHEMDSTMGY
jgi:hypothetical protein